MFPGQDVAVSLFLTSSEIWTLSSYFSSEHKSGQEEMVIYSAGSQDDTVTDTGGAQDWEVPLTNLRLDEQYKEDRSILWMYLDIE